VKQITRAPAPQSPNLDPEIETRRHRRSAQKEPPLLDPLQGRFGAQLGAVLRVDVVMPQRLIDDHRSSASQTPRITIDGSRNPRRPPNRVGHVKVTSTSSADPGTIMTSGTP
jgi:hypothetical protein